MVRASFLFVVDLNGHHQDFLDSLTANHHGDTAFDYMTVSGNDKLVVSPTHAHVDTLNLLMTDVPGTIR